MPLKIVRNDITKMDVDAIVNPTDEQFSADGGVDGAILKAAGNKLAQKTKALCGLKVGEATITEGYELPAKYIIHTVGPAYKGYDLTKPNINSNFSPASGDREALLRSCYRSTLALAKQYNCQSVAFPLISSGAFGYPEYKALKIAANEICDFLLENEMTVYLVLYDRASVVIGKSLFSDIAQYIDDNYVDTHTENSTQHRLALKLFHPQQRALKNAPAVFCSESNASQEDLNERLKQIDESFSQMLLRKIDERGMTDTECYKKANIDRKLFSKIRSDVNYRPSKPTAIAFAISLKLTLAETQELLRKAGFALSHSNKFDIIIEYFISKGCYDIFEINEALFAFDQSLLG